MILSTIPPIQGKGPKSGTQFGNLWNFGLFPCICGIVDSHIFFSAVLGYFRIQIHTYKEIKYTETKELKYKAHVSIIVEPAEHFAT